MSLIPARSLDDYLDEPLDDDDEFGASSLRESRQAYRQARRRNRRVSKRQELESKTAELNRDTRKVRRGDAERGHKPARAARAADPPEPRPAAPRLERSRSFPGATPPGPRPPVGPAARSGDPWRAPAPPEEPPPEDWGDPEGFEDEPFADAPPDEQPEEGMSGRLRRARPSWGAAVDVGDRVRVQARSGHRAAVMELQPGLYLLSEFPEESEFGVVPVLATLMVRSAARALTGPSEPERRPLLDLLRRDKAPAPTTALVPVQAPLPALGLPAPVPAVGWVHPDDAADLFGCAHCRQRRR